MSDTVKSEILSSAPVTTDFIIREWVRTEFSLPASIVEDLDEFFLRVWDGSYVVSSIVNGTINLFDSGTYIVHWTTLPSIVGAPGVKAACSFRRYKGQQYCVIKVHKPHELHVSSSTSTTNPTNQGE